MNADAPAPKRRGRRLARWAKSCLFGLAALVVALVLVEGALRLVGPRLPPRMPPERTGLLVQPNEELAPGVGLFLQANGTATTLYPGSEPGTAREITYAINSLGFRGPEVPQKRPKGVYRIALLGDSVTYGTGINYEETIAAQLQQALAERLPKRTIQVINCGVPSTNTAQQVAHCVKRVLKTQPNLVLIITTIVDASGQGTEGGKPRRPPWQVGVVDTLGLTSGVVEGDVDHLTTAEQWQVTVRRASRLADLVSYHLYRSLYRTILLQNYKATWERDSPGVAMIREALTELTDLAERRRFKARAAMYPFLAGLSGDYPFREEAQLLADMCADLDLPFDDLLTPLKGQAPASLQAHAHDRHPNGRANGLVAQYLADILVAGVAAKDKP